MDRYGLASGKKFNFPHDTLCDREFERARHEALACVHTSLHSVRPVDQRQADRELVPAVRRLVRAALDVERQRAFEKGMEAFAAMPMVRERNVTSGPGFWTGD